jgi:hypothetical protein
VAGLRREGLRAAVGRLLRAAHPHDVAVRAVVGLGDPADTGMLWSVVGPAAAVAEARTGGRLEVRPDFDEARLTVSGHGRFSVVPGQVLWALARFALHPATVRAAWTVAGR